MSIKQLILLMACLSTTTYATSPTAYATSCTEENHTCPGGAFRPKDEDCNLVACPLVLDGESCIDGSIVDDSNPCAQGLECVAGNAGDYPKVCKQADIPPNGCKLSLRRK